MVSFRPGDLKNPYSLPQALIATGYRYSSSVTANNSLTHLPFQLTHNREARSPIGVYEFPVTLEDESLPSLLERLPQAVDLARKIAAYGGTFVLLIHPNITGHKLEFEKAFLGSVGGKSWIGTVAEFGSWWSARDKVGIDVESPSASQRVVRLELREAMDGLVLDLPEDWTLDQARLGSLRAQQHADLVVFGPSQGSVSVHFNRETP